MLHEFVTAQRDEIILRARTRVAARAWPSVSTHEIEFGVPLFLTQLVETLRLETTTTPFPAGAIESSAAQHGGEMLGFGFTVSQVVQDYGDICQTITGLAIEQQAPVTVEEFRTLNLCLDKAIAKAVTEHARLTAETRSAEEVERLGHAAHELRNNLNSAMLAFHTLKRGSVAVNGSTGAVLGRSLVGLRDVIDRTLSEVRLSTGKHRHVRIPLTLLLEEIASIGALDSEHRKIRFTMSEIDPELAVEGDPQLLSSAIMNLVTNALKNTPPGGHVTLGATATAGRLVIAVEDECGGIPESKGDLFAPFTDRRGVDRSGLGLGLSIAQKAVKVHQGDIRVRNLPGKGCIFTIEMPLAATPALSPADAAPAA